ncbi:MAG TPA: hypothetical protein VM598_04670, partial [Bdellovibrionota bacterium]|nr:hypothetical protein [Bdellovibrionota bacterium]
MQLSHQSARLDRREPDPPRLSPRAYQTASHASSWEEIWEAGPYYARVGQMLENAKRYAIFVGWQIDSRLQIPGTRGPERLRDMLVRLCEERPGFEIFVLMWAHAYFYVPERELWQARIWEDAHPRIHFVFDSRHPFGASHHEKVCIVDGEIVLCGGIDLCDERWDSPDHLFHDRRRSLDGKSEHHGPYHDLAVQVTGEVCAWVQDHVGRRWREISSIPFPSPPPARWQAKKHLVYVSRTMAEIDMPDAGP